MARVIPGEGSWRIARGELHNRGNTLQSSDPLTLTLYHYPYNYILTLTLTLANPDPSPSPSPSP